MKKILFFTLIILIFASGLIYAETYYIQDYTQLLHKPEGETIGILQPGFEVDNILGHKEDWWKIRVKEDKGYADGWIQQSSLSTSNPNNFNSNSTYNDLEDSFYSNGFKFSNVSFKDYAGMTKVIGEIENNTGKDYSASTFIISVYDGDKLVETGNIVVSNISDDQKKSFEGIIDIPISDFDTYDIQFENGY